MTDEIIDAAAKRVAEWPEWKRQQFERFSTVKIPDKLIPTHGLRWNGNVLEQRFLGLGGSPEYWVPVPQREKP